MQYNKGSDVEYIICAAIHNPDETDLAGEPLIYCGHRHHNILWQNEKISRKLQHQGFLTSKGRYVSRRDAVLIAVDANQIKMENLINLKVGLFSEDLY